MVAILLDHHASVGLGDGGGSTPLHFAAIEDNTYVIRHLLALQLVHRETLLMSVETLLHTPLDYAEIHNHTAAIELLNELPEIQALDEVNSQMHAGSQVMGGLICTVWQEPPQEMDSLDLEQAIEQDLDIVVGEVCEDGKLKPWLGCEAAARQAPLASQRKSGARGAAATLSVGMQTLLCDYLFPPRAKQGQHGE